MIWAGFISVFRKVAVIWCEKNPTCFWVVAQPLTFTARRCREWHHRDSLAIHGDGGHFTMAGEWGTSLAIFGTQQCPATHFSRPKLGPKGEHPAVAKKCKVKGDDHAQNGDSWAGCDVSSLEAVQVLKGNAYASASFESALVWNQWSAKWWVRVRIVVPQKRTKRIKWMGWIENQKTPTKGFDVDLYCTYSYMQCVSMRNIIILYIYTLIEC